MRIILFASLSLTAYAQVEPGIVRVKLHRQHANAVRQSSLHQGQFGIAAADKHHQTLGVKEIKRVFQESGKFEKAHQAFGLHLWYEIRFDPSIPVDAALKEYRSVAEFEVVEQKLTYTAIEPVSVKPLQGTSSFSTPTSDPQFNYQWHYENTGQSGGTAGADISLVDAWALQTGSTDVIVAVIDGGIDYQHPDLSASMWINTDEIPGNNFDDDGNGYIDDQYGYGFGDNTGTIYPHYHGTHVAGTIAAVTNNGVGVAGIAGGSGTGNGVRLMSCAGFGAFGTGGFENAMVYAADNGAVISQNSWRGGSTAIEDAIDYFVARAGLDNSAANFDKNLQVGPMAGGIVIFAAGNDNTSDPYWGYPASYPPNVAVAATDHNDMRAWFSNYGSWVDVSAPGYDVYSTYPVNQGSYAYLSGTSMACPHASGVAALLISQFKGQGLTAAFVRQRLEQTTDNINSKNPGYAGMLGTGRVNAFNAVLTPDDVPPGQITDLTALSAGFNYVKLQWTAPGGSGNEGSATEYDIRYSTSPINQNNFSAATQVSGEPVPMAAGSIQSFKVPGLKSLSTYYFAMRSSDFFRNISVVSNIVSATTVDPPVAHVGPNSLEAALMTNTQTTQTLTIENSGVAPLSWDIETGYIGNVFPPEWLSYNVTAGEVISGGSTEVEVTIDAAGLFGGKYGAEIYVRTDDPSNPVVTVPVTLTVTGVPDITPNASYFDFGQLFSGLTAHTDLIIKNTGTDTLHVDALTIEGDYFETEEGAFSLPPTDSIVLNVQFNATTLGAYQGKIRIESNDPDTPIIEIPLSAETIPPPVIEVDPDGITATMYTDEVVTVVFAIGNSGASDLIWNIYIPEAMPASEREPSRFKATPSTDYMKEMLKPAGNEPGPLSTWWLSVNKYGGTISPGQQDMISLTLDVTNLIGGVYNSYISITSNDPLTPYISIPVNITILDAPNILVEDTSPEIGSAYVGSRSSATTVIHNTGSSDLTLSLAFDNAVFSSSAETFVVAPDAMVSVPIYFSPLTAGTHTGALSITTNDPDEPTVTFSLESEAYTAPLQVTPVPIHADVVVNSEKEATFSLTNLTGSAMLLNVEGGGDKSDLESLLEKLGESSSDLTMLIPNMYQFSGGEYGYGIDDGGNDMYDGGNFISTDESWSYLNYSQGVIQDGSSVGLGSYFTFKTNGLFVMAATDVTANSFQISGNLGADGSGQMDASVITVVMGGVTYKGFIKRVYNAWDPSVNHLIIVRDDNNSVTHEYSTYTDSDYHRIQNLDEHTEIYYLLFAGYNGAYVNNASMRGIMEQFLGMLYDGPSWFSVVQENAFIGPAGSVSMQIRYTPGIMDAGNYESSFRLRFGDESLPPFEVPVTMTVIHKPVFKMQETELDFQGTYIGLGETIELELKNTGSNTVQLTGMTCNNSKFKPLLSSSTIPPYSSVSLYVTYNPDALTNDSGLISFTTNDIDNQHIELPVRGHGANPSILQMSLDQTSVTVKSEEMKALTLTLENIGAELMVWDLDALPYWVTPSQSTGALYPGQQQIISMMVDASSLWGTVYTFNITANYNNPFSPNFTIPVVVYVSHNQTPSWTQPFADVELENGGDDAFINLALYSTDPDNDLLSYTVYNFGPSLVDATLTGSLLQLKPKGIGKTWLYLTVLDSHFAQSTTLVGVSISQPVGVEQPLEKSKLRHYPNPADGEITIEYAVDRPADVNILLFDLSGKPVDAIDAGRQEQGMHQVSYNVAPLAAGFYFYQLIVDGKTAAIKKLIKK